MWNAILNPDQHDQTGPLHIQSFESTNRTYPSWPYELASWRELGYTDRPGLDGNAGDPNGISMQQENRNNGKRQIAAAIYPLDGVTVLLETMVARLAIERNGDGGDDLITTGIELTNGTIISAREVIVSAGGLHSPQLLKLSGTADELRTHGTEVLIDAPDVGRNYIDHPSTYFYYNVHNPNAGRAVGSDTPPPFDEPQFDLGMNIQMLVSGGVPRAGLIEAITADNDGMARIWRRIRY